MQNAEINHLDINGCYEIIPNIIEDKRGMFVKTFHKDFYNSLGLIFDIAEEYYSISTQNALRGIHFQIPPYEHYKIVYCIKGEIQDGIVDLRKDSTTYGKAVSIMLNDSKKNTLVLPPGIAHGFLTISQSATVVYKTSSIYSPQHDKGILWQNCGIKWQCDKPLISERDLSHPSMAEFQKNNPFNK